MPELLRSIVSCPQGLLVGKREDNREVVRFDERSILRKRDEEKPFIGMYSYLLFPPDPHNEPGFTGYVTNPTSIQLSGLRISLFFGPIGAIEPNIAYQCRDLAWPEQHSSDFVLQPEEVDKKVYVFYNSFPPTPQNSIVFSHALLWSFWFPGMILDHVLFHIGQDGSE